MFYDNAWRLKKIISFNGGSSENDIRVFNNYASNNLFFWNRYILVVEFIDAISFVEVIDI